MNEKTVTVQHTAKRFKLASRFGGWCTFIGVFWATQDQSAVPATFLFVSLLVFLYGRFGKWWNHE